MSTKTGVFLSALVALVTTSCAIPKFKIKVIDPKLANYVSDFEWALGTTLANTDTIVFGETKVEVAGYAQLTTSGFYKIVISRVLWENLTELEKYQLVWHELGHSECGLEHDNTFRPDGKQNSIMFDTMFLISSDDMSEYYMKELVAKCLASDEMWYTRALRHTIYETKL